MSRNSKKLPVKSNRSISDFFTRKSATISASSTPKLTQTVSSGGQSQNSKPLKLNVSAPLEKSVSLSSISHASVSSGTKSITITSNASTVSKRAHMATVEIASPPPSTRAQSMMSTESGPVKRSQPLETWNIFPPTPHTPRHLKSPNRPRKPKFDSDSDGEKPGPVVYIARSPVQPGNAVSIPLRPAPLTPRENLTPTHVLQTSVHARKKARLSSPEPFAKSLAGDLVPSSQSDESEMAPLQTPVVRDARTIKKTVDEWRQKASSPAPVCTNNSFDDSAMDIDGDVPLDSVASTSTMHSSSSSKAPTRPASSAFGGEDTLFNLRRSLSASPIALDPETKAARIIADIKAKAYAASLLEQPDSPVAEFKEDLSDSSDEEDCILWSPSKGRGKHNSPAKYGIPEAKQVSTSPRRPSGRYALRSRELSPSPSTSKHHSPGSSAPTLTRSERLSEIVAEARHNWKGMSDPLDQLLKEKRRANKAGKGDEAFRRAEAAVAERDSMLMDSDSDDWTNENLARKAVVERDRLDTKGSSPAAFGPGSNDIDLDESDRRRLFGEARGDAIVRILEGDKVKTQQERESEKIVGVPFWSEAELDDHMEIDEKSAPVLDMNMVNKHPIISLLSKVIEHKDYNQAALLMGSGAFAGINFADYPTVIPYFCELALLSNNSLLSTSSFQLLIHIWDYSLRPVSGLSFSCILTTLIRLGAKCSIFDDMGWTTIPGVIQEITDIQKRDEVLYRLLALLTLAARSRRLTTKEVPDILMAMILIANEPSSSFDLQREVMVAVDEICRSVASGADISAKLESTICTRILKYASTLQPVNRAYIVSLLGSGTGRTRRIARWVAHGIITDKNVVRNKQYCDLPRLFPILAELTRKHPDSNSEDDPRGKFEQHAGTDFVNMAFYVQILGVAITNVLAYVMEEHQTRKDDPADSDCTLDSIRTAIDNLHSSISDIRAVHLDRSRAKAALKELSYRIHYQRLSATQSARTLHQYFPKTKKQNTST